MNIENAIEISFNPLGHGWADLRIRIGNWFREIEASDIADTPAHIANALKAIAQKETSADIWIAEEPPETLIHITRISTNHLRIEIHHNSNGLGRDNDTIILDTTIPIDDFVRAAIQCFTALAATVTDEQYREVWTQEEYTPQQLLDIVLEAKAILHH